MGFESYGESQIKLSKLGSKVWEDSISLNWSELKVRLQTKDLTTTLQYLEEENTQLNTVYLIWFVEDNEIYHCLIDDTNHSSDVNDFEDNFKSSANQVLVPLSMDNKKIVRAESRPLGCTTIFTCIGDSDNNIGDGKEVRWNFSNDQDNISMPSGSGLKRKRIEFKFLDFIYVKEGAIYFHNVKHGSYVDMYVVCPAGQYYLDHDKIPHLAEEDTIINHYLNHHFIQGNCPMGDELNTEACSNKIPSTYKFWLEITVPDDDNNSTGYASLEIYRERSCIL